MKKLRLLNLIPLIMTIPAVAIGAMAMKYNGIPMFIWIQNIVCLILMGSISYIILSNNINIDRGRFKDIFILISLVLLILTFIASGIEGVHRWISIGPIKFNVSMIVLPISIIFLWELLEYNIWCFPLTITFVISILLFIQPDASQLSGFAIPMMIMLCKKIDKNIFRAIIIGSLSILVVSSWIYLDGLSEVVYVERIVSLVANMGQMWFILGIIFLAALPVPFILFPPKRLRLPSMCIGLYFIIIILSNLFGNFPVPLMGYGMSPIIGYVIAVTWYVKSRTNKEIL